MDPSTRSGRAEAYYSRCSEAIERQRSISDFFSSLLATKEFMQ